MSLTYNVIASQTVSSPAATIDFTSIPSTYTDLVLRMALRTSLDTNDDDVNIRFNSDTGANYGWSRWASFSGSSTASNNNSATQLRIGNVSGGASRPALVPVQFDIFSYANTSVFKSTLSQSGNAYRIGELFAGQWRSTTAISSISVFLGGNVQTGSKLTLFGITRA